jgi:heavy metal translocating P-type ATPase
MTLDSLLRSLRPWLVAAPALGLAVASAAWHGGFSDLYGFAIALPTLLVMLVLAMQIGSSLRQGEFGLDVIALLSMGSALYFGETLAAGVVALMYAGGQYPESIAEGRAQREMTILLSRTPRTATREVDGRLEVVAVETIVVGDRIVVRRGDLVPVDGIVLDAVAVLDEAALTGETLPAKRAQGTPIMSGAGNLGDLFRMRATRPASESTYAGIVRLVETARRSKAPMARLADRYALLFLLVTVGLAALGWLISGDPRRAVAVLVIATPCPLILAVPIAWAAGMSRSAQRGLLVKGARVMEGLGNIRTLVLDKTGTLTEGRPTLAAIQSRLPENELLQLVASLDQASSHTAARALVDAAKQRNIVLTPPTEVTEQPGEGVVGKVSGRHIAIGSVSYIALKLGVAIPETHQPGTMAAAVAIDDQYAGTLLFSDRLREGVAHTLNGLRQVGVKRIILASGDSPDVARHVAGMLPFDRIEAGLSPEQKIAIVQAEKRDGPVMMIGDGINDAPALAAADIGLAMGVHGSAGAAEAADAVLLVERLDRVLEGMEIARGCRRIALQSVFAGIGLSVAGMMVAAAGYLTPIQGAFLQEAIDVAVILNALRALRITPKLAAAPEVTTTLQS